MLTLVQTLRKYHTTIGLMVAIGAGSAVGLVSTSAATALQHQVDSIILALVFLLFLEVPYEKLLHVVKNIRFLSIAWATNFILIPLIGFAIAAFFLQGQPLLMMGLLIYFMSPCTDWFLAFTKIAHGDTATGSILLPINMISQLLLYPVYLMLLADKSAGIPFENMAQVLLNWFFWPFVLGIALHIGIKTVVSRTIYETMKTVNSYLIEGILTLLVFFIFASNITTIAQHLQPFVTILIAVFVFFVIVYVVTARIADRIDFTYPQKVLYCMTTSARNAPLMLAVTMAAFPNQPLIYAAIIIGMLVEFPHLTIVATIISSKETRSRKMFPRRSISERT